MKHKRFSYVKHLEQRYADKRAYALRLRREHAQGRATFEQLRRAEIDAGLFEGRLAEAREARGPRGGFATLDH